MDSFDLDFFKTPGEEQSTAELTGLPICSDFDVRFGKKKYGSKRFELAQTIAKVDELVQEIDHLKSQNSVLQQKLKDFQMTAQQVQELYIKEKNKFVTVKENFDKLQKDYSKIDVDLTNMSMVNDQMKARLAEYDGRPINFNNLVVKYVKIMDKLEGEDILRYNYDKDLVERLREYCAAMKLKVKPANSVKKTKSKGNKITTQEMFVQCDLFKDTQQEDGYQRYKNKLKIQDQNTQCITTKRDQASQYISTMVTRQTNTDKIVQKHVKTMFPEPPAIDDILKVFSRWSNIRSVSPLLESPSGVNPTPSKGMLNKFSTTGTCTMLCNIRRKIDYLPLSNSSHIKQEMFTPSASPTPTTYPIATSRASVSSLSSNVPANINTSSILNFFNSTTNSSLGQLSSNAFNELWQIFGKMLLSLLQTNNAGITNINQASSFNQQQFLDWLRELYMSSQTQTTSAVQTQTLEQTDTTASPSPLPFNDESVLYTNVVRPQPQKTWTERTYLEDRGNTSSSTNSADNNTNSPTHFACTLNVPLESISHSVHETQITSNTADLQAINICESNLHEIKRTKNTSKTRATASKKQKTKHKILKEIQELLPEINANEKTFKALKRLLKNNHRKKDFEARKNKKPNSINKQTSSVVALTNESNNDDNIETAVDFLKTFAVAQESNRSLEETFSETEKSFLEQISNANITNNVPNVLKSAEIPFIRPVSTLSHSQPLSNTCTNILFRPPIKRKNSETTEQIKNRYQTLFGYSDSELEDEELEITNSKLGIKPVIECANNRNENTCTLDYNQYCANRALDGSPSSDQETFSDVPISGSTYTSVDRNATSRNTPNQLSSSNTPISKNYNYNFSQGTSVSDIASILKDVECTAISDICQLENAKDSNYIAKTNYSFAIIENNMENDLKLCSDDDDAKIINIMSNADDKLNKEIEDADGSVESYQFTAPIYSSAFEKDFDLSSDEESLINETDFNATHRFPSRTKEELKDIEISKEHLNSNSLSVSKDVSHKKEIVGLKSINVESKQEKYNTLNNWKQCFGISESNHSIKPKEDSSEREIEQQDDKISNKEHLSFKTVRDFKLRQPNNCNLTNCQADVKMFKSNFLIECENGNNPFAGLETPKRNPNSAQSYEQITKQKDVEVNLKNLGSNFLSESENESHEPSKIEIKSIPNSTSNQQKINFNCKERLKPFPSSTLSGTEDNSLSIASIKMRNGIHKSIQNFAAKTLSVDENSVLLNSILKNNLGAEQILPERNNSPINLSETKEGNNNFFANISKSNTIKFSQSHSTKNESINQTKCEDSSLGSSVITVSGTTLNEETLNRKELLALPERKCVSQISGLKAIKLLELNNKHNHQKASYNSTTNITEIMEGIGIPNNSKGAQTFEAENDIKFSNGDVPTTETKNGQYSNMPYTKDDLAISSYSSFTTISNTNTKDDIKHSISEQDLNIGNKNDFEKVADKSNTEIDVEVTNISVCESFIENASILKAPIYAENVNMAHDKHLDEHVNKCTQEIKTTFKNTALSYTELIPIVDINSYKSMNIVDQSDLSDSLSIENELMIDEDISDENNTNQLDTDPLNNSTILTAYGENCNETTNSTNISTLLSSTLYNEDISESIKHIVDDLLNGEVLTTSITSEIKPKRGRKRKSECLVEKQPCKRSQRLKAKQLILEDSLNLSKIPVELGKYTKGCKNVINNNVQLKSRIEEDMKKKNIKPNYENSKLLGNEKALHMGFFRETDVEDEVTLKNDKIFSVTKTLVSEVSDEKTFIIPNEAETPNKQEHRNQLSLEREQQKNCNKSEENEQSPLNVTCGQDSEKSYRQKIIKPLENCIYSESPLSPAPIETNNEHISDTFVIIPPERLPQFMPQDNVLTLFDVLVNSYKNENQKQVLESVTTKELKRQENILNQFDEQLKLYCGNEMELDLYCTSTRLINKLLSISPDFNLIQKALITIVENAEGKNELPLIMHEMPPRHLPKCLQRLFVFLKNVVTRNSNFCKDLISKIELLLFNTKQHRKLSLQATLNLTQLFLMACKVQEYMEEPKHPARLFIAKCLYFYMQKSTLMIHEVLMWYPTVLPYREDKTYDRSDALISVIQQILMNTKYDMDKTKTDLRGKELLSKLRYEYHFEPYKPSQEEVINILMEKLKTSKFYNISLAFSVLCKRVGISITQNLVLNQHLLPLANEYYSMALKTTEYDKRIAVLLEIISMLVKPLPIEIDIQKYFNEFSRFLNGFERQIIQEAALCSILRLQRFNMEYCYKLLRHFQPTYDLNTNTQAMLKTFLYRRPITFWKNMRNAVNFN